MLENVKTATNYSLSQSNISTISVPTGLKLNRARFFKQISKNTRQDFKEVIEVEGKYGKYCIEKINFGKIHKTCWSLDPQHTDNPHELYNSEIQLFYQFQNEQQLFPNNNNN